LPSKVTILALEFNARILRCRASTSVAKSGILFSRTWEPIRRTSTWTTRLDLTIERHPTAGYELLLTAIAKPAKTRLPLSEKDTHTPWAPALCLNDNEPGTLTDHPNSYK